MPSTKTNNQDLDAHSDSGSTISLASCGSALSGLTPKPPLDGTFRSKSAKGKRSKVAQSTHSPYASRQVTAKRTEATNSNTRNLWLTSMKNGTATLSTNNTAMNTWAGPRPSHAKKRQPGSRTRNFSDVVEFSNSRTKSHSRSATLSYAEPQVIGGGPALKPAEDYYDEIIELKKVINSLKEDNNLLSTKLHRVEEENIMKDRKMDDLLNSRKQPEDLRRTLTDKRGDTSSIVNSLKQKLHAVERTVKEKETELSNLRKDLKMTDTEELRIQSETYYQEIQRLQLAMLQMQQESINYQYSSSRVDLDMSDEIASARGKRPISAPQQRLQRDVEMLKAENRSLKKDLISAVESQSKKSNKKSLNVDYADMSRGQLLHTIHELELKLDECKSRTKDSAKEKHEHDEKKDLKKGKFTESEDKLNRLEENQAELLEEREKLRNTIERLKEDRTHYRNVADDLRKQLKAKEEEVEDLQHKLSQISTTTGAAVTTTSSTMKRKSSAASTSSHLSTKRQSFTARERDLHMEKEFEEFKQRHAAKVLQKQWRSYQGKKHVRKEMEEQEKQRQEAAAKTLQREWKKHLMQKDKALQDGAITDIQAAFRGHLVRKDKLGKSRSDLVDSDDAIISVQSAMRGHLTRSKSQEQLEDEWSHDKSHDSNERISQELSDDDDDDIVIIRSSHYENKSPFSSKKRSSFTAATVSPNLTPPQPTPRTRSPPHPAPRTLKGLDTTPPSPAPRHKVPTPEVLPQSESAISDDDSDDDNVVIGGSSVAHTAQSSDNSSEPKQMKQNSKQNNQSDSTPTATVKERQSSSCIQSNMDIQLSDQVFNETESDSDNDLVVCGKTATNTRMTESKEKKNSKYEHQEMSNEKQSVALSNEDTSSSSLTNEKPLFVLSHENASNFSRNEKPLKSSTNNTTSNSSSEIDKKPSSSLLANENPYLGLTGGNLSNVPEITRNRVFKWIKWSQTNDDIKQKEKITAEDKTNPENENQLDEKDETEMKKELEQSKTVVNSKCNPEIVSPKNIPCDQKISSNQASSCDSVTSHDLNISHDNISVDEHTTLQDHTVSNEGQISHYTTKPHQEKKDSKDDKGVKESTFDTSSSGLTKNINPQRTITELSEESDDQVVTSWHQSQMRTNDFQKTKSSSAKKTTQIQHEIIDSDDDEVVVSSTKGRSSMISKTYRNSDSSARKTSLRESEGRKMNQGLTKVRKTSSRELHDSDEESDDDVVVTSSKKNKQKATFSPRSSYSKNTASPTKRESLVDHLLIPKRPARTSEDIRTTRKSLLRGDDEDDEEEDDDDNIFVGSWRNESKRSEESSLKKDSLSSLWSGSSKQNKKGSSGFGFGSFKNLSSSSRHADSNLDELF